MGTERPTYNPPEVTAEEIAKFWSEMTDDEAPLNLNTTYLKAAERFLEKYMVHRHLI